MKKIFYKFIIFIVIASFACSSALFSGCDLINNIIPEKEYQNYFTDPNDGKTKYVLTDISETELLTGMTQQILVTVSTEPETADFSQILVVSWESENESVASVNKDGVITAVAIGKTKVYAKLSESVRATVSVSVVKKELTGIEILYPKKTFVLNSGFKANFTCQATFNGKFKEIIEQDNLQIDSYAVNTSAIGEYPVKVYYDYGGKKAVAEYTVYVRDSFTYDAEYLSYTYKDVYQNSCYANIRTQFCPSSGEINYLVIPVYFTDSSLSKTESKNKIEEAFFGASRENGWNSVKTFYETASNGKLTINGKVSDWFNADYSISYYGDIDHADRVNSLAESAVNWYFTETGEERADYDSDHNGTLDAIAIIYGCPDNSENNFWGQVKRTGIAEPNLSAPTLGFYMWASYNDVDTDVDPLKIKNSADSHVFIHETGHLFGLNDYYDYGPNHYNPAGGFITMELNTGGQDPFSCLSLGWAKAIVPETSCTVELKDFQSGHEVIVLSPNPERVTSPFDEYIIIELYSPTGLNKFDAFNVWQNKSAYQGMIKTGIRIWHVDARLVKGSQLDDKFIFSADTFYTDPRAGETDPAKSGNVEVAFTNSWDKADRISVLGEAYQDYSLLFSVRKNDATTYKPKGDAFNTDTMFYAGNSFSMAGYSSQFKNGTKLNSGDDLNWTVEIENITGSPLSGYTATINLTFAA